MSIIEVEYVVNIHGDSNNAFNGTTQSLYEGIVKCFVLTKQFDFVDIISNDISLGQVLILFKEDLKVCNNPEMLPLVTDIVLYYKMKEDHGDERVEFNHPLGVKGEEDCKFRIEISRF